MYLQAVGNASRLPGPAGTRDAENHTAAIGRWVYGSRNWGGLGGTVSVIYGVLGDVPGVQSRSPLCRHGGGRQLLSQLPSCDW